MTMFFYCHSHEGGNPGGGDGSNSLSLRWERAGVRVMFPPPSRQGRENWFPVLVAVSARDKSRG